MNGIAFIIAMIVTQYLIGPDFVMAHIQAIIPTMLFVLAASCILGVFITMGLVERSRRKDKEARDAFYDRLCKEGRLHMDRG